MTRKRRLFLAVLYILLVGDICRYIKTFIYDRPTEVRYFDLLVMQFDRGIVVNTAILYIIIVSVVYFAIHFFSIND